jgi:hypothetical protein
VASAASSRSTQCAPSLDTSLSPPSTPTLEITSTSTASSRDVADSRLLRSHALRLETLASDAQQRLEAESRALRQVHRSFLPLKYHRLHSLSPHLISRP